MDRGLLRSALKEASLFFPLLLVAYTRRGRGSPLLLKRGISIDFIRRFEIGLAPRSSGVLRKILKEKKIDEEALLESGLLDRERREEFFRDRITFPIKDKNHLVIGFSARKYKEETFGGKYINTSETSLFKKSRVLFGLNYSLPRISREKRVIIVEGQIDCLRLIEADVDYVVAAQGTAFGQEHAYELERLGVQEVLLLFDGDSAVRRKLLPK